MNYDETMDLNNVGGIFKDSEGLQEHIQVRQLPSTSEGVRYSIHCGNCGQQQIVTLRWAEIYALANKNLPVDERGNPWRWENGLGMPLIGCIRCKSDLRLGLTPDEAFRSLQAGMNAGLVQVQR